MFEGLAEEMAISNRDYRIRVVSVDSSMIVEVGTAIKTGKKIIGNILKEKDSLKQIGESL